MIIKVFDEKRTLGQAAAEQAAKAIQQAIKNSRKARVVAASAASQFEFLDPLTSHPAVDWKRVELFHLDEYIGLPMNHPASFCRFLQKHLIDKTGITNSHLLKSRRILNKPVNMPLLKASA
jgi:glucosamine-6-phosphate deaminase